jgi:hypothetical protein
MAIIAPAKYIPLELIFLQTSPGDSTNYFKVKSSSSTAPIAKAYSYAIDYFEIGSIIPEQMRYGDRYMNQL